MEIKKEALEKLIQESIDEMQGSMFCQESFAIYIGDGYEVQVVITADEDEFMGSVPDELEG